MICLFQSIDGSTVTFVNGQSADFDFIVKCTGYKIDLPFLSEELKRTILDEDSNSIKVIREIYFVDITITKKKKTLVID